MLCFFNVERTHIVNLGIQVDLNHFIRVFEIKDILIMFTHSLYSFMNSVQCFTLFSDFSDPFLVSELFYHVYMKQTSHYSFFQYVYLNETK